MKRTFLLLAAIAASAVLSMAQPGPGVHLSPVPTWPADGVVRPEFSAKYVFVDIDAGQLVIAVPENLGEAGGDANTGPRRILRFDLENQVRPSVSTEVRVAGPLFTYDYRVANDASARKPIMRFNIVVPASAKHYENGSRPPVSEEYAMAAPPNWKGSALSTQTERGRASTDSDATPSLSWFKNDPRSADDPVASAILPGAVLEGFRVESTLRPGFTTGYFRGGGKTNLPGDLPRVVLDQAVPALKREFNSQVVPTIGPMFDAATPTVVVVNNFHAGIDRMVAGGLLDGDSPAVKEALAVLKRYMDAAAGQSDQPLENFVGPSLSFTEGPKRGREAEILAAMRLSLPTQKVPSTE